MDLSIIIVSYNTRELLKRCLESLIPNTGIIVVDNGSNDGSREFLRDLERRKYRNIEENKKSKSLNLYNREAISSFAYNSISLKVIFNKNNVGFAKANNQGIKIARGKYILLLNSDTQIRQGTLAKLIEFAEKHPEAGAIGARLLNPDSSVQPSIYHLPTIGRAIGEYWLGRKGTYEKYASMGKNPAEVEAVTGAAMLIPRRIIEKVGFLDERYFFYFEDLDFCRRVRRAGFKVYYLPSAEIIHHHGASGKEIPGETQEWLGQSSKIYHGILRYYLITFIIWVSQKWRKLLGNIKA